MGGKKVKVRDEREERGPTSSRADRRCAGAGVEASELSSWGTWGVGEGEVKDGGLYYYYFIIILVRDERWGVDVVGGISRRRWWWRSGVIIIHTLLLRTPKPMRESSRWRQKPRWCWRSFEWWMWKERSREKLGGFLKKEWKWGKGLTQDEENQKNERIKYKNVSKKGGNEGKN